MSKPTDRVVRKPFELTIAVKIILLFEQSVSSLTCKTFGRMRSSLRTETQTMFCLQISSQVAEADCVRYLIIWQFYLWTHIATSSLDWAKTKRKSNRYFPNEIKFSEPRSDISNNQRQRYGEWWYRV